MKLPGYLSIFLLCMLKLICIIHACVPVEPCPADCSCNRDNEHHVLVQCNQGNLDDYALHDILSRTPPDVTHLHIIGEAGWRKNRFQLSRNFGRFGRLRELRLRHGSIRTLGKRLFEKLHSLRTLDVSGNQIEHLSLETFENSQHIERLDLSENRLGQNGIPSSAFFYLENLRELSLAGNQLTTIAANAFQGLSSLESLSLADNPLGMDIKPELFVGLNRLQELDLAGCGLALLEEDLFKSTPNLTRLSLARNGLYYYPHYTLKPLLENSLLHLDLSQNQLSKIPMDAFNGSWALESLNLGHNQLNAEKLTKIFAQFPIPSGLSSVSIAGNCMKTFNPVQIFGQNLSHQIQSLDISENPVAIGPQFLASMTRIQHLNLAATQLSRMPDTLPQGFQLLRSLNLSGNPLGTLTARQVNQMDQLRSLDISHCRVTQLLPGVLTQLSLRVPQVYVHGNAFTCDCNAHSLHTFLQQRIIAHKAAQLCNPLALIDPDLAQQIRRLAQISCARPVSLRNRRIATLFNSTSPNQPDLPNCSPIFRAVGLSVESEIGILSAIVFGLILVLILASVIICSYLWHRIPGLAGSRSSSPSTRLSLGKRTLFGAPGRRSASDLMSAGSSEQSELNHSVTRNNLLVATTRDNHPSGGSPEPPPISAERLC